VHVVQDPQDVAETRELWRGVALLVAVITLGVSPEGGNDLIDDRTATVGRG
jgi:hypothetical protein